MDVLLFIPCLVEDLYPEIGEAAARVLARAGAMPRYPENQTCCGQPLYKLGRRAETRALAKAVIERFPGPLPLVAPSGSCVHMIRDYPELFADEPSLRARAEELAGRTFELSEFLVRVLGKTDLGASLSATAVHHDSCQVGRALGIKDTVPALLAKVKGLTLLPLERPSRCCGFGGTFSAEFPEISETLLEEKIEDILARDPDVVISAEVSCLMNIGGALAKRGARQRVLHLAQVLDRIEEGR